MVLKLLFAGLDSLECTSSSSESVEAAGVELKILLIVCSMYSSCGAFESVVGMGSGSIVFAVWSGLASEEDVDEEVVGLDDCVLEEL